MVRWYLIFIYFFSLWRIVREEAVGFLFLGRRDIKVYCILKLEEWVIDLV